MGHTVRLFSLVTHIIWDLVLTAYLWGIALRAFDLSRASVPTSANARGVSLDSAAPRCVPPGADRTVSHQPAGGRTLTTDQNGASAGDGTRAAARLLEIAARNADELLDEARAEATSIVTAAQTDADQLTASSEAQAKEQTESASAEADRVLAAAHTEADRVQAELEQTRAVQTAELEQYRTTVLSKLAERTNSLEAEVARLEQLEKEHRNRMRDYLTQQLAQLDATPG